MAVMKYTPKHESHERPWCISQHPEAWQEWSLWYLQNPDASNTEKLAEQQRLEDKYTE